MYSLPTNFQSLSLFGVLNFRSSSWHTSMWSTQTCGIWCFKIAQDGKIRRTFASRYQKVDTQGDVKPRVCCTPGRQATANNGGSKYIYILLLIYYNIILYWVSRWLNNIHFCFQACNQLEIACYVKQTVLNLRWDAVRVMKAALAGTATTKFLNVMEAAFSEEENEEEVPDIVPTEEDQPEHLPSGVMTTKEEADIEFGEPSTSAAPTKRQTIPLLSNHLLNAPVSRRLRVRSVGLLLSAMLMVFFQRKATNKPICTPVYPMSTFHEERVALTPKLPSTDVIMQEFAVREEGSLKSVTQFVKAGDRCPHTSANSIWMSVLNVTCVDING